MAASVLDVSDLSIDFVRGEVSRPILSNVSFALGQRGILGIVGESGSGKSVLARALVGSIEPPLIRTSGRASGGPKCSGNVPGRRAM